MNEIDKLVNPKSIAVIGASHEEAKLGFQIMKNLIDAGFKGPIYPVNPKGGEILGREVSARLLDVPGQVDLAVIVIPGKFVKDTLLEAATKGVKAVIVISAGFAETGHEGKALQDEIVQICRENNIVILGPNCLGMINTENGINATFAKGMPKAGNISLLSQSGAVITAIIDWSMSHEIGFDKIFSLGNKALLDEAELLEYLYGDPNTKVVICYLEQLVVNPKLTEVLTKSASTKPTVVLFGGKSAFGAKAAASHTGSIVSSYLSIKTYLAQAGVLLADSMEDLLEMARSFSVYDRIKGKNIAIITNAGGPSIAASDAIAAEGLNLANLSEETQNELRPLLSSAASVKNPVDILGDGTKDNYRDAIAITSHDPNVDAILVILTPQSGTDIDGTADVVSEVVSDKPVFAAFVGGESLIGAKQKIDSHNRICYGYPEDAIKTIRDMVDFENSHSSLSKPVCADRMFEMERKDDILEEFNLPVLRYFPIENEEELRNKAGEIGYPVVLKTANPAIVHKSDSGAVKLNIKNEEELLSAFAEIGSPAILGKMIIGKHQIFLGMKKDENIGTVVAFGTGGIYAEIYKDLSYGVTPISHELAKKMILSTKMGEILNGARGQKPYDLDLLANIIVNTGNLADTYKNLKEIDFNPVMADQDNFYLVDTRIILE